MKAIMTGVALTALIAAAPAGAQTQPQPVEPQEMQDSAACPEGATETTTGEACPPDTSATAPDEQYDESDSAETTAPQTEELDATTTGSLPDESADEPAAAQTDEIQTEAPDMVAEERGKFIGEQADDAILASELVGLTVYNPADEVLGDVNDVVWYEAGDVEGVIIGVGGFLGIGEKSVAVSYEALEITTDQDGNKKLVFDATHDELAAAPEFLTQAEKLAMAQAEQEAALPPASGGGMAPAPAPAPAE
jgi:sporulation protein YlmC with PRC-barrel domain